MPYIKQDKRPDLDVAVEELYRRIKSPGDLNYVLFKLCRRMVSPSYMNYRDYVGELYQCIHEIQRRIIAPYEDTKIKENGDVI